MSYLIPPVISCWLVASILGGIAADWKHQTRTLAEHESLCYSVWHVTRSSCIYICLNQISNVLRALCLPSEKKKAHDNRPDGGANKYFHRRQRKREQTDQTNLAGGPSSREGRCLVQNQCGLLILYNTGYKNSIGRHAAQARTFFSSLVRTLHTLEFISWRCSQTITITTTCIILSLSLSSV